MGASEVNENTRTPLRVVAAILSILIPFVFSLGIVYSWIDKAKADILDIRQEQKEYLDIVRRIDRRLYKIELANGLDPEEDK